ncbi:MAG: hypothetical protein ACI39Q_07710, partial [Wujia sp.]
VYADALFFHNVGKLNVNASVINVYHKTTSFSLIVYYDISIQNLLLEVENYDKISMGRYIHKRRENTWYY